MEIIECNKCKHEFSLDDVKLKTETVKNENNQEMLVTYFLCPKCKTIYVANIIDDKYRRLSMKLNKSLKILKRHQDGQPGDSEGYRNDFIKKKNDLMRYEQKLKDKYIKYLFLQ